MSWAAILAGVAAVGALLAAEQAYESHLIAKGDAIGAARVQQRWDKSEAAVKVDAERAAAVETARARAETAALQLKFDQLAARQQKERVDYEIAKSIAVAGALAGNVRLSVAVAAAGASGTIPEVGAVEGAGSGAGPKPEARADLLPGTAATILRVAGDYGQLVRDYNSLLERFETAHDSCNVGSLMTTQ